jgi:hypothetical protein
VRKKSLAVHQNAVKCDATALEAHHLEFSLIGVPSEFGQQSTLRKSVSIASITYKNKTLQTARQAERHSKWFVFSIY